MNVIQPNCRAQFAASDIDFIISVLSSEPKSTEFLIKLLSDPDSFDTILDDELIFRSLLERPGCLQVSSHFYFYVLVRRVLRLAGIEDRTVADYVAAMLAEFSNLQRSRCPIPGDQRPMDYIFEMLTALQKADDSTQFLIRAHVGNHSLFVSGVFPDRIQYRAQYKGAPEIGYYETLGQSNFRVASDHRLARRYELAPIFGILSEHFHKIRLALNDMSERLVFLGDRNHSIENIIHPGSA